jgi:hypothetical protein
MARTKAAKAKPTIKIPAQKPLDSRPAASNAATTKKKYNLPPQRRKTANPELELPVEPAGKTPDQSLASKKVCVGANTVYTGKFSMKESQVPSPPTSGDLSSQNSTQVTGDTSVKPKKDSGNTSWTEADEKCLVELLVKFKAEAGIGCNFKAKTFRKCVKPLEKIRTTGGPKTADSCSRKYTKVSQAIAIHDSFLT